MKEIAHTRRRRIPGIIGCPQYGLADGRRIRGGVFEQKRDALVIQHGCSLPAVGDSLGNEKQLGMLVECQNRWFVSAVRKESQWNSARLENTSLSRIMKYGEEVAGIVIRKDIERQVVAT